MLKLETKSDLERLKNDDIQESVTLDYKDAAALGKTSPQRSELCKDVSAFANSAGGQIIYGIQEDGHHPVRVQYFYGLLPICERGTTGLGHIN
jgi:predicted HTH transcriptional regulator